MIAYNRCPRCGLKMGFRKEPDGLYRCRKCKRSLLIERDRHSTRFTLKPDGATPNDPRLEIPRV